jgi:hypothetical protein
MEIDPDKIGLKIINKRTKSKKMKINLNKTLLTLSMILCVAGLIGCTTADKPTTQTNAKPVTTTESNTKITENSGNNNTGTTTVEKTTVETKDGIKTTNFDNSTKSTASSSDKIGIEECDDYIEKYEACITGKVPESARAMMKSSFDQTRKTWKDLAANPQTKNTLASMCKQAKDATQKSMETYKCEW